MYNATERSGLALVSFCAFLALAAVVSSCTAENAAVGEGSGGGRAVSGSGAGDGAGGSPDAGSGGSAAGGTGGQYTTTSGSGGPGSAGQGGGGSAAPPPGEWVVPDASVSDKECAKFSAEAQHFEVEVEKEVPYEVVEAEPVAIYIMLDRSGSMWIPDPGRILVDPVGFAYAFKWIAAVDSITNFVNDPASANIDVALQYFPLADAPCDGSVYETPAVPMGRLPDQATPIVDSMLAIPESPGDGTPIEPALIGATRYCAQFMNDADANPEGLDCVVVLITDGMPTLCNQDTAYLASIAGDAYQNDGVITFAVGMAGADPVALDLIAQQGQGGNDCHSDPNWQYCDVSYDITLLEALELIRSYVTTMETRIEYETVVETQALECEWELPDPPEGEDLDLDKVNVEFSPTGEAADTVTIPMAEDESACDGEVAWYYAYEDDDDQNPTRIVACPQACDAIEAAEFGTIGIVIGCEVVELE